MKCAQRARLKRACAISDGNEVSTVNKLSESGELAVPTVMIDEDIEGPVTLIKMDIEGAEANAQQGCCKKILENHPKLILSVYHNHDDMWRLAREIYRLDPSYRFYLRNHGGPVIPTEYLLYAV